MAKNALRTVIDIFKSDQPEPLPLAWKLRRMSDAGPDSGAKIAAAKKRLFNAYDAYQKEVQAAVDEAKGLFKHDGCTVSDTADLMRSEIEKSIECYQNQTWQAWVGIDHGLEALRYYMGLIVNQTTREVRS
ncbi:hypothetical protein DFW101_1072 [Solidesulfovibrio carbinoliphilus subsp. oakridgensis]|uniref:Uncharacterized protein n=1 Tax=Solidesulfovibrio carbinoliphilus subsp. oakridgensis TaxID=694327 RepID=G7Q667_9BACT|nr:hypothetical protein [Solidesulfovibrio carbinoliphilus]EHJ47083.1 hypothetical protein DFW101_1072 [Solidesulfovibrio carbinoliphilus subsp. oakridgensis]